MKHRWLALGALALGLAGFVAGQVAAQDEMGGGMQMPEWTKRTKRTKQHEDLAKMVGTWDVTMKMWMVPDSPPMESTGISTGKALLGGNYVQQDFEGSVMGGPFEGVLMLGYDTVDKEFVSVWMDSFHPVMYVGRGTEKDGLTTYDAEEPDFMTGKKKKTRMTIRLDPNAKAEHACTSI